MELRDYISDINTIDFKSDGNENQDDVRARILAESKLGEMNAQLKGGKISKEDFDKYFQLLKELMLKQDADIRILNEQFEKEKVSILKASAKERMDGGTDSLLVGGLKKLIYLPLFIDEDLSNNNETQNFLKGVIDELLSLPEVLELLITDSNARSQMIEALSNISWEQIKESFHFGVDNAYEIGRTSTFAVLTLLGLGAVLKSALKVVGNAGRKLMGSETRKTAAEVIAEQAAKKTTREAAEAASREAAEAVSREAAEAASREAAEAASRETLLNSEIASIRELGTRETVAFSGVSKQGQELVDRVLRGAIITKSEVKILQEEIVKLNKLATQMAKEGKDLTDINTQVARLESAVRQVETGAARQSYSVFEQASKQTDNIIDTLTTQGFVRGSEAAQEASKTVLERAKSVVDFLRGGTTMVELNKALKELIKDQKDLVKVLRDGVSDANTALKTAKKSKDPVKIEEATAALSKAKAELKASETTLKEFEKARFTHNLTDHPVRSGLLLGTAAAGELERIIRAEYTFEYINLEEQESGLEDSIDEFDQMLVEEAIEAEKRRLAEEEERTRLADSQSATTTIPEGGNQVSPSPTNTQEGKVVIPGRKPQVPTSSKVEVGNVSMQKWVVENLKNRGVENIANFNIQDAKRILNDYFTQYGDDLLKKGKPPIEDSGAFIYSVQYALKSLGINFGIIDGLYGKNTKSGVTKFQEDYNIANPNDKIKVDGLPGVEVTSRLLKKLA